MPAITASRAKALPIGELSKRSGVNIETICYYERVKMLATPARTANGRRICDLQDIPAKLEDLKKLERLLLKTVARCTGKTAPDCTVLDILDIHRSR
jgi:MerR family transcriptional regulator, mercuric resistance operon regulatory protein